MPLTGVKETKKMKKEYWYAVLAVAVVAILTVFALWRTSSSSALEEETHVAKSRGKIADVRKSGKKSSKKMSAAEKQNRAAERAARIAKETERRRKLLENLSAADRRLVESVQKALDEEDFEATQEAVVRAMKSEDPAVRAEAVDALGWFGDKALVDLTKAMADKDPDVAETARGQVENALMGMEDDDRAVVLAGEYVNLFAEDEEAVTMFAGVLSSAATRIIDPDDDESDEDVAKAKGNRAGIVDIVSEMIGKGGKLAEKGRELYEEISGEEWTDREAANKWADDIEKFEADPAAAAGGESQKAVE